MIFYEDDPSNKKRGKFLSNYVWINNNHIGVILSAFIKDESSFWKFKRYNRLENWEEYSNNRGFCIQFRLDGPQRLTSTHCIQIFDCINNQKISSNTVSSTKNLTISRNMIVTGGKSASLFCFSQDLFSTKWTHEFPLDQGIVTPVMGKDSLLSVVFSTEWAPYNSFRKPNPGFQNIKLVSMNPDDGAILQTLDIPLKTEYRSPPYSNIAIGDIFYLDCGWHIAAVNSVSGTVIWESELLARKNELKPQFIYSSSIIPTNDILLYCQDKKVIALDRMTGCFVWEYFLPEMPDEYYYGSEMRIAVFEDKVIITGLSEIHAIYEKTGKKIWIHTLSDSHMSSFTSVPKRYNQTLIVGRCDPDEQSEHYSIVAIDLSLGTETFREDIDFKLTGNPGISGDTLYWWSDDSLHTVSLVREFTEI